MQYLISRLWLPQPNVIHQLFTVQNILNSRMNTSGHTFGHRYRRHTYKCGPWPNCKEGASEQVSTCMQDSKQQVAGPLAQYLGFMFHHASQCSELTLTRIWPHIPATCPNLGLVAGLCACADTNETPRFDQYLLQDYPNARSFLIA
jgi:hypothetical protein